MKPEHLDGEYAQLWIELRSQEVGGRVEIINPEDFEKVRELESLGGCTVIEETANEMTVELIHQPEEEHDEEQIRMASKQTKFAK